MNPTTTSGATNVAAAESLLTLDELAARFADAARALYPGAEPVVAFEAPRRAEFGDLATNLAFGLAKAARKAPQAIAAEIAARVLADPAARATIAEATPVAGFVNLRLVPAFWQRVVAEVLRAGADYGRGAPTGECISLEFGSANPTGPLVVVQGRTLSIGDSLAKTLRHAGYDVFTEWIINDAGSQIDVLGRSLYARYRRLFDPAYPFPEEGYPGDYLIPLAQEVRARDGERWLAVPEDEAVPPLAQFARDALVAEQQAIAHRFGVDYDLWQSEKALHESGAIERGIQRLRDAGVLYEKDGATWLRTKEAGDDEDRVVIRSDGRPTYFAQDVAYHYDKLQRANRVIDILGPDHHGYIGRLNALANAYDRAGAFEVLIAQLITLKRGEEILSMSKRAGTLLTLADVIDEVGVDAARFFFVMLSTDQPLTFDLELAKKQSNDNPVYYVQYSHARIASVLRRATYGYTQSLVSAGQGLHLKRLTAAEELQLARRLSEFGPLIQSVAKSRAPHRLTKYARDLAQDFHRFYDACRVLSDDAALTSARLSLCFAAETVLAKTLYLCGVSAPDEMERAHSVRDITPHFMDQPRTGNVIVDGGYMQGYLPQWIIQIGHEALKALVTRVAAARTMPQEIILKDLRPAYNCALGLAMMGISELRSVITLTSIGLERSARIHLRSLNELLVRTLVVLKNPDIADDFVRSAAGEVHRIGSMLGLQHDIAQTIEQHFLQSLDESSRLTEKSALGDFRTLLRKEEVSSVAEYAIDYAWLSQYAHGSILSLREIALATDRKGADFARHAANDGMGPYYILRASQRALWQSAALEAHFNIEDDGTYDLMFANIEDGIARLNRDFPIPDYTSWLSRDSALSQKLSALVHSEKIVKP